LLSLVLLGSCQVPKEGQPTTGCTVSFGGITDSVGIAAQKWRDFFGDEQLTALIDTALSENFDLLIATQRIAQAQATFDYSRGFLAPQVNAVSSVGVDRYGRNTLNGVGNYDTNLSDNVQEICSFRTLPLTFFWVPAAPGRWTYG
jgi:outer membrane protein TolC